MSRSGFIKSFEKDSLLKKTIRSALEGAVFVLAAAGLIRWKSAGESADAAMVGVVAAWLVSTISVAALLAFRGSSFQTFLRAFAAGAALRMAVLAGLMFHVWGEPQGTQSATLGSYAGGILVLLCVEYRQLNWK